MLSGKLTHKIQHYLIETYGRKLYIICRALEITKNKYILVEIRSALYL
jgi:hypothetical protein